jgi:hypothetical protein
MARGLLEALGRDFSRGLGRQAGFRTWKQLEKEVAKKVIDPNSKFRKQVQKFTLPGKPKLAIEKLWTLIDGYVEEYEQNTSLFQDRFKEDDINFIDKKLFRITQMHLTDDDIDNLSHLSSVWKKLKNNK